MSERIKTLYLWLLECKDVRMSRLTRLFTFYAESQEEAERLVNSTLTLQPHLVFVSLIEWPDGFIFFHYKRPGQIEVEVKT
jgi:hypothetical protein